MCHAMYLAADIDLPLVAPTEPPGFSVEEAERGAEAVTRLLPGLRCLRYLGANTGCSCGFHGPDGNASRAHLVAYLRGLPAALRLRLYGCWEGEWDLPALEHIHATCAGLLLPDAFAERRIITIDQESPS